MTSSYSALPAAGSSLFPIGAGTGRREEGAGATGCETQAPALRVYARPSMELPQPLMDAGPPAAATPSCRSVGVSSSMEVNLHGLHLVASPICHAPPLSATSRLRWTKKSQMVLRAEEKSDGTAGRDKQKAS
ncbi:unnamed protein product [Urochloa humidicola]